MLINFKEDKMNHGIIDKLRELKPELKEIFGIEEFAVFGSVANGTDIESSDVEIAILKLDLKDAYAIFDAKDYLSEKLNKPIDIGTFRSMRTFIKNRIKKDFILL